MSLALCIVILCLENILFFLPTLKVKAAQCVQLFVNSPGQNIGVDSLSLLQGIFPTQGSNLGLPHCGQSLYQLSHKGSPRILEWVTYLCSSRSSQPRDWTGISCIAGRFFTNGAIREALLIDYTLIQNKKLKKKKPQWAKFTLKCTIHSGEKKIKAYNKSFITLKTWELLHNLTLYICTIRISSH